MQATVAAPSKAERIEMYRSASWARRLAVHDAIAACKREAMEARRDLGRRYLERHPGGAVVPYEKGSLAIDLGSETTAAREEALALSAGRASQHDSLSLQYPVLGQDFAADSEAIRFGLSPVVIAPITRYCGMLPVLFNMFVTHAFKSEFNPASPHAFHLDPEDTISFKVFVHLTDVTRDSGPFHTLAADATEKVLGAVGYQGIQYISDQQVADLVGWENVTEFTGPKGSVALADTTRCLHFGGRPRGSDEGVRSMLVYQYLLPTSLLFPIDGDSKHPRFLPQLEPRGDDEWDALIGARLT
jgi:hypothetical protein